jgi:hypothetical protein
MQFKHSRGVIVVLVPARYGVYFTLWGIISMARHYVERSQSYLQAARGGITLLALQLPNGRCEINFWKSEIVVYIRSAD